MGFLDSLVKVGLAPVTGGASLLAGEDTMARLPLIGPLTGSQTDAEKALLAKQRQMAAEAAKRQQQQQLTAPQMNATAQSMLAFNPLNQKMAQTYGAQAAFTPQQFAQMVQNPNGPPLMDQDLINYQGTDPKMQARLDEYYRQRRLYEEAEARRRQMMEQGLAQPGPGPAPLGPRPAPAPARRF